MIKDISFSELEGYLRRIPVLAEMHPLGPLALPRGTKVMSDSTDLLVALDSPDVHDTDNLLVMTVKSPLANRLPIFRCLECPPIELLNERMHHNLFYARQFMLRNANLVEHIVREVTQQASDIVIFYLVDGLSFLDVQNWPFEVRPCFVDGPSVTYQLRAKDKKQVSEDIGFPCIVGRPSLAELLYPLGYRHARGYTYWNRDNSVADYMFRGVPVARVNSFEMLTARLREESLKPFTFVQIFQEGLDGLAHHRRELRRTEIDAAINKILADVSMLVDFFRKNSYSVTVFLTADHGILWRTEHEFQQLANLDSRKPRYSRVTRYKEPHKHSTRFDLGDARYDLFHYPFLAVDIKSNDSGVHGGLSAQESIVPLVKIRG